MNRGIDFLKSQINNAVMQHQTFLENLEDHQGQAEDPRFRGLCARYLPMTRDHLRMLEQYQQSIGAETGVAKKALGKALGVARDIADAVRESDFLRLVGDIVTARQSQDTMATFREVGTAVGDTQLQQVGEMGARQHEEYAVEANRLAAQMFLEHMRGGEGAVVPGAAGLAGAGAL